MKKGLVVILLITILALVVGCSKESIPCPECKECQTCPEPEQVIEYVDRVEEIKVGDDDYCMDRYGRDLSWLKKRLSDLKLGKVERWYPPTNTTIETNETNTTGNNS